MNSSYRMSANGWLGTETGFAFHLTALLLSKRLAVSWNREKKEELKWISQKQS